MPPSSQRRARTRKLEPVEDKSEVDDADTTATPSRKKRRMQAPNDTPDRAEAAIAQSATASRRRKVRSSDFSPSNLTEEEKAEEVIRNFRISKQSIQARTDHANEKHEVEYPAGKTAYAKISGNGWTFYVTEVEVRIGRPPDERYEELGAAVANQEPYPDSSLVHIDLGPSKLVSRLHAEIKYDDDKWSITVMGRNGIKLDEEPLPREASRDLHSGSVIEIAGTQMMFVTPGKPPIIHPKILAALGAEPDDEHDGNDQFRAPPRPSQRTPGRGGPSSALGQLPHSPSRDQNSYQNHGRADGYTRHHAYSDYPQPDGAADLRSNASNATKSPRYSHSLLLDTTEDIDFSLDTAKDIKPPHSYAQLIGMAVLSVPEEKLTLAKIYDFIKEHYAFYRFSGGGWQNSIRHNLSLNKCFEKVARRTDEPGKGMKWQIVPEHRGEFMKRSFQNPRKAGWNTSSDPASPLKDIPYSSGLDRGYTDAKATNQQRRNSAYVKNSPDSVSPIGPTKTITAASTPDRGGAYYKSIPGLASSPGGFAGAISPFPDLARGRFPINGLNEAATARTPGGPALHSARDVHDSIDTPFFARPMPKFAPPSTAHLPSQFMPLSSPAPFWKYANEFATSPVKNLNSSPTKDPGKSKTAKEEEPECLEPTPNDKNDVRSSSPPVGLGSPTRALSSRGRDINQSKPKLVPQSSHFHPPNRVASSVSASHLIETEDDDDDDGPPMDLAKGFQTIGNFHRSMNTSAIRGN